LIAFALEGSMIHPASFAKVRFSTADLPERDRVALWREHYRHTIFRADVAPVCDASFQAAATARALPQLHLRCGALSAARVTRSRAFLADGNDDVAFMINRAGRMSAIARGREVALREGDAVLVHSGEITTFDRSTPGGSFSIRIPHCVLSSLVVDLDDVVMRLIPRRSGALKLLGGYVDPLLHDDTLATAEFRHLAAAHVHDLVALALGATRDAAEVACNRGVRAARLRAAKDYVVENCRRRSLSIGTVAEHLGVTPRYLQKLFEIVGGTFSAFLLGQRLARAHRMLMNPKFDHSHVSAIAYDVGFGDLSYFNRTFRQRYGATPRDIRGSHVN